MPELISDDCLSEPQTTVFKKLISPIDEFVATQNDSLPKHHNQKYEYYDFFVLLVFYFISEYSSLKLLINGSLNKGLLPDALKLRQVPYSTCSEAFERFSPDLFRTVFQHLTQNLYFKEIPELVALGTLYCIDGSLFPVISSMLWADYTSTHKAVKLHLCLELNRMIPIDILVTAGNSNERKALLKMLTKGVTYIADRGYGAFYIFHEIVEAKAHFIIRIKTNILSVVEKPLTVQLPTSVQYIFRKVNDELIRFKNDKHAHTYRRVSFYIGLEYFYVLTDRQDLTTFQIIMLYAYRWQIELMFRFLKRTMNGLHLIKQNQQGVTIQFYMMLIVALLELHLKQETMDIVSAKNSADEPEEQTANDSISTEEDLKPEASDTVLAKNSASKQDEQTTDDSIPENMEANSKLEALDTVSAAKNSAFQPEEQTTGDSTSEKMEALDTVSAAKNSADKQDKQTTDDSTPENMEESLTASCHEFIEILGKNVNKYWKIGIYWLTALRKMLASPFDKKAIKILGAT